MKENNHIRLRNQPIEEKLKVINSEVLDEKTDTIEQQIETDTIEQLLDAEETKLIKLGFVTGCSKLNVRKRPNIKAEVVCEIIKSTEVTIDEKKSNDEFYKVITTSGVEGYCMKKFIAVQP